MNPPTPGTLRIRIKKGGDGNVTSFALHRSDGTFTVQRNVHPFFPVHDLTHYAVETTLRHRRGFYGLVAEGWNFEDFGQPWPRGHIPDDSAPAELIVGFLDLERATGIVMQLDEFNEKIDDYFRQHTGRASGVRLTEDNLVRIRTTIQRLAARWHAVPPGQTMELDYVAGADAPEVMHDR